MLNARRAPLLRPRLAGCLLLALSPLVDAQGGLAPSGVIVPSYGYGATNRYFGRSVALHQGLALIGATGLDGTAGTVDVLEQQPDGAWLARAVLEPPAALPEITSFGYAVTLESGRAAVGAPGRHHDVGQVVVFEETGAGWQAVRTLVGAVPEPGDDFGASLAMVGEELLVGVPGEQRVEVFQHSAGAWIRTAALTPSQPLVDFGATLAFDGTRIVVGAPGSEAAVVFTRPAGAAAGTPFQEAQLLRGWVTGRTEAFGASLSLYAGNVLVGAPSDDGSRGAAYLFRAETPPAWAPDAAFLDPLAGAETCFGASVSLSRRRVVVGAPGDEDEVFGVVHVYERAGSGWRPEQVLDLPLSGLKGTFGRYVSAYGDTVMTSIGLDDTLPFGFYGGAILSWRSATASATPRGGMADNGPAPGQR